MPTYSIGQAARLLGVSPETVRRWADGGRLTMGRDGSGNRVIDGMGLARFAKERALAGVHGLPGDAPPTSVRNAFTGIVTALTVDDVVARVEDLSLTGWTPVEPLPDGSLEIAATCTVAQLSRFEKELAAEAAPLFEQCCQALVFVDTRRAIRCSMPSSHAARGTRALHFQPSPCRYRSTARTRRWPASVRGRSSLVKMLAVCFSTARWEMPSPSAIAAFVWP